jgi:hypothetical protein
VSVDKTTVTLTTLINGTLVDTTVDVDPLRSTQGLPGFGYIGADVGKFARFDNFVCSK